MQTAIKPQPKPGNKYIAQKILVLMAATALASYIALAPAVATSMYYRLFLFFPARYPLGNYDTIKAIAAVPVRDVYFKSKNGSLLHGWYFQKPGAKYTTLYHHGNGSNLSVLGVYVELFLRNNCSILIYDYQGYGKSEGEPSLQNVVDDSQAAYNYLTGPLAVRPQNIIHCGGSFGTGLAAHLAQLHPGRAIILLTPYAKLTECARLRLPFLNIYPDFLMPGPDLNTLDCAKQPHPPLFMVHGDDDWIIPVAQADEIYRTAVQPKEYLRLHNVGHGNFITAEFESKLSNFLDRLKQPQLSPGL